MEIVPPALMMIVDSNTWADFFNGTRSPFVQRLETALKAEEDLGVVPLIITEVLQGFRTDRGFRQAERIMITLPVFQPYVDGHVRAARLFRSLKRKGITIRGAVDCIIAQACLDIDAELLSPDRNFQRIARHTSLRLWSP